MSPPTATHSEATPSESSLTSSFEDNNNHESETSPMDYPILNNIRKLSRGDAERHHNDRVQNNLKKPRKAGIQKTKRQRSNIRSAEICRSAKNFYIGRLERTIAQEEETSLQITKALYDQIAAIVQIKERITKLEEKKARKEQNGLWIKTTCEETPDVVDNVVDEFFPVNESCFNQWEENIELFINDDHMMCGGYDEMDVPMTPPPTEETTTPMTPQNKKQMTVEAREKKMLRSPVSLLDLAHEVPQGESLRPSLSV